MDLKPSGTDGFKAVRLNLKLIITSSSNVKGNYIQSRVEKMDMESYKVDGKMISNQVLEEFQPTLRPTYLNL